LYEPNQLPARLRLIAHYNPIYHVIDVFRRPLIGETAAIESYIVATALLVVSSLAAFLFFRRFRGRIAYWL
jgi:ABC-type polysaccharide/polyol phosphate export permease